MSSSTKIQRFIDLMATLLAHKFPRTFLEIAREVPGYGAAIRDPSKRASVKRTFERDKKELKEFGVPLETHGDEGEDDVAYGITAGEFYLPYLSVASPRGRSAPRKVDRYGYRALAALTFAPDELEAVAAAAARARGVGDPGLAADVDSAMRKLAFDLPVDAVRADGERFLPSGATADPVVLQRLGAALVQRKRVTFEYHTMSSDVVAARHAEPYGLFFLGGHWYLVARDVERDALRNFRVSRISAARPNEKRAGTPDYEIPSSFRLREHARARRTWEIGDGESADVVVRFSPAAPDAAKRLGAAVDDEAHAGTGAGDVLRRFPVRRLDAFVRWILSFAGSALPVAPDALVAEYRRQREATLALYEMGTTTGDSGR